jgi:hypothetical protein
MHVPVSIPLFQVRYISIIRILCRKVDTMIPMSSMAWLGKQGVRKDNLVLPT